MCSTRTRRSFPHPISAATPGRRTASAPTTTWDGRCSSPLPRSSDPEGRLTRHRGALFPVSSCAAVLDRSTVLAAVLVGTLLAGNHAAGAAPPSSEPAGPLHEIIIEAPEPRFVAPTRRDRIG